MNPDDSARGTRPASIAAGAKQLARTLLPRPAREAIHSRLHRRRIKLFASIAELKRALDDVERAFEQSEDAGRAALARIALAPPRDVPSDPHSPTYREYQFALYRAISGRSSYVVANETSPFDLNHAKLRPFPHQTGSPAVVGEQLIAQGFLLKALSFLPPKARLLEFGPGWGNTTLHFLQLGYSVKAVEIDEKFVELVRHRGAAFADQLDVVQGDMLSFTTADSFDAAIFFECFHHCADHVQLIRQVKQMLRPGGVLVLASEPIGKYPYPWGVRLDGQSLWAMRRYGWLELGFETSYLFGVLEKEGFRVERRREPSLGTIADVVLATRK